MTTAKALSTTGRVALALALSVGLTACAGLFGGGDKKVTPTVGNRIPILSRIESAKVDPSLAGVSVILPPATVNAEWAQAGGTAGKSYGHLALSDNLSQAWTAKIAGSSQRRRLAAAPVIGGGMLFVEDSEGVVNAFDAETGARRWTHATEVAGNLSAANFGGGVSYDQNRVYVTNGVGEVLALDASNGSEIWKVKPGGPLRGSPTIAFGSVYVMTQDNQIFALSAADGKQQWNESGSVSQTGVFGVAAPAAAQGTVIAGYSSGELVAYRYENGRSLWSDALARTSMSTEVGALTDIDADPIIDSGRVYALGQGGRMAAYELVTGQRIWELNLAGISTPAVAGEWIFTLTDDARLLAIARGNGKIRWITDLGQWRNVEKKKDPIFWTGPVLAGGQLWVGNSLGQVYRVSPGEGAATLFQDVKAPISLAPVVANNTLYLLDDDGVIHAYR
ncbi:pyrrolo-quinoline quinone [Tsuneonella deserti]|uniref:Pyrrolo-quinoline quinone n=1 Tax=Tsuneonella deserti TaxID=2035528 RepID=A0ABQ1S2G9_9SPHN|nr:PQQ-binding-like beta-propeller repeat protein [Tsuneonella deserti]GGD88835.1 pyrrolo-quinoline quinone [Tsuneonella deserti]